MLLDFCGTMSKDTHHKREKTNEVSGESIFVLCKHYSCVFKWNFVASFAAWMNQRDWSHIAYQNSQVPENLKTCLELPEKRVPQQYPEHGASTSSPKYHHVESIQTQPGQHLQGCKIRSTWQNSLPFPIFPLCHSLIHCPYNRTCRESWEYALHFPLVAPSIKESEWLPEVGTHQPKHEDQPSGCQNNNITQ